MMTPDPKTFWSDYVAPLVEKAKHVPSRSGKTKYRIHGFDAKVLVLERGETGSLVRIPRKKVETALQSLLGGVELKFRTPASRGGIDYTIAKESGVLFCLGDFIETDAAKKVFRLRSEP